VVGDDKAFDPERLADDQGQIGGSWGRAGVVVHRDHAAEGEAGEGFGGVQGRFQVAAADIFEIDIYASGRCGEEGLGQVLLGLVVDHMVDADLLQIGALFWAAGRADHRAALNLGDLTHDLADRSGGGRDEHHIARLHRRDLQEPHIGGQAWHARDAEEGLRRQTMRVDFLKGRRRRLSGKGLAPA